MQLIADILLVAGSLGAGLYCFILGRRLNRFNDLEKGVGGAVAVLSAQVEDLRKTLSAAQATASASAETLTGLTERAESMSRKLELQMASLHDIPDAPPAGAAPDTTSEATDEAELAEPPASGIAAANGEPMFMRRRRAG